MNKILIYLFIVFLFCQLGWGEFSPLVWDKDVKAEYRGECASCLERFIIYEIQGYRFCENCYFDKYKKEEQIALHPSRYCSGWCAHTSFDADRCPYKDKPSILKKERETK